MKLPKKKLFKIKKDSYHTLVIFPISTIILLILCVVIFGLGLDKRYVNARISGYIVSSNSTPIANAAVCIEEICTISSEEGYFELVDLKVGEKFIEISSTDHLDINQLIKITKGENIMSFSLAPAEVTNASITITGELGIDLDDLKLLINGKGYPPKLIDGNAVISFVNYKTGIYEFSIASSTYVDTKEELVFEPGVDNLFTINLEPATSVSLQVKDWLSGKLISDALISAGLNEIGKTNKNGESIIEELSIYTKSIKVSKDGYLQREILLDTPENGVRTMLESTLIPEGKIVYRKLNSLGNQIYLSNLDGSEYIQLTTRGENSVPVYDSKNSRVYYLKTQDGKSAIYYSDDKGVAEIEIKEFDTSKLNRNKIDYLNDLKVWIEDIDENKKSVLISSLNGENQKEVFKITDQNVSNIFLTSDSKYLIYGRKNNQNEGNITQFNIKNGQYINLLKYGSADVTRDYTPVLLTPDEKNLILESESKLYLYNFAIRRISPLTETEIESSNYKMQPGTNILSYIVKNGEESALHLININTRVSNEIKIDGKNIVDFKWLSKDILCYVTSENEVFIVSPDNLDNAQLVGTSGSI
jgi:hypothetical protein